MYGQRRLRRGFELTEPASPRCLSGGVEVVEDICGSSIWAPHNREKLALLRSAVLRNCQLSKYANSFRTKRQWQDHDVGNRYMQPNSRSFGDRNQATRMASEAANRWGPIQLNVMKSRGLKQQTHFSAIVDPH